MKKLLTILLSLAVMVSMMGMPVFAAEEGAQNYDSSENALSEENVTDTDEVQKPEVDETSAQEESSDTKRSIKSAKMLKASGQKGTEGSVEITDGTYTCENVKTDVTTAASGMIMVVKAKVVVKDGQATAIVTMKGTGADRLYVSDTATKDTIIAEAVAEEQKEVGGQEGNLIGGLKLEGDSAYSFWPIPITLGEPRVYAARSASHFASQDKEPEKYYYVHDFQIDAADLVRESDSTEVMTPELDAQKYLNQYYLDGKISSDHTGAIKGKADSVTVPYYEGDKAISSFKFKRLGKYRAGWFIQEDILNTTYFSSSNLKKINYPEGRNGTVTFQPKQAYRDSGMEFTATLKLYPADANYNQYDASGVYYDKEPLAVQAFTVKVQDKPVIDFDVEIVAKDVKTGEAIEGATIKVVDEATSQEVQPKDNGKYNLNNLKKYTITASKDGFVEQGGAAEATKTGYFPKKEETVEMPLIKVADSMHTVQFHVSDQFGEDVADPTITVTRGEETVAAETDGSYRLYDGIQYRYTVACDGYESYTYGSLKPSEDTTQEVKLNKYLDSHRVTFRIYADGTGEEIIDAEKTVTVDEQVVEPNEDGSYTVPDGKYVYCNLKKEGYQDKEVGILASGFEENLTCTNSMTLSYRNQLIAEIGNAQKQAADIVEGDQPLEYPEGTKATLEAEIGNAISLLLEDGATEEGFQTELSTLKKAEKAATNAQIPDEGEVTVRVNRAADEPAELMTLYVRGDTAKSRKYAKPSAQAKKITILDVMVAVHDEIYGEEFAQNPTAYLEQDDFGIYVVTKIFGKKTNQTSYALNNKHVDHMAYQKTVVRDGDLVTIKLDKGYNDMYLYFENMEETTTSPSFNTTLCGYAGSGSAASTAGYTVTLANENGTDVQATSDENGELAFNFKEEGTYTVKSATKEGSNPITVPYLKVRYVSQLKVKQEAALAELDLIDTSAYSGEELDKVNAAIAEGKEAIEKASTTATVDSAMAVALIKIGMAKTDVQIAQETAVAELDQIDTSAYSGEELEKVNTAIAEGKEAVKNATTLDEVDAAMAGTAAQIKKAKTDVQIAQAKAIAKLDQIDTFAYSGEELEKLNAAIAAGRAAIASATTLDEVEAAKAEAAAQVKQAKTDSQIAQAKAEEAQAAAEAAQKAAEEAKKAAEDAQKKASQNQNNPKTAQKTSEKQNKINNARNAIKNIAPSKVKVKKGKKKITVKWKPDSKVFAGYQIKVVEKKSGKTVNTVTAGASAKKTVVKKLQKKTKYVVTVRGYKTVEGTTIYGKAVTKTVKVK